MKLEEAHVIEITKLKEYIDSKEHPLIQIVRMYEGRSEINASYLFPWKLH